MSFSNVPVSKYAEKVSEPVGKIPFDMLCKFYHLVFTLIYRSPPAVVNLVFIDEKIYALFTLSPQNCHIQQSTTEYNRTTPTQNKFQRGLAFIHIAQRAGIGH